MMQQCCNTKVSMPQCSATPTYKILQYCGVATLLVHSLWGGLISDYGFVYTTATAIGAGINVSPIS